MLQVVVVILTVLVVVLGLGWIIDRKRIFRWIRSLRNYGEAYTFTFRAFSFTESGKVYITFLKPYAYPGQVALSARFVEANGERSLLKWRLPLDSAMIDEDTLACAASLVSRVGKMQLVQSGDVTLDDRTKFDGWDGFESRDDLYLCECDRQTEPKPYVLEEYIYWGDQLPRLHTKFTIDLGGRLVMSPLLESNPVLSGQSLDNAARCITQALAEAGLEAGENDGVIRNSLPSEAFLKLAGIAGKKKTILSWA